MAKGKSKFYTVWQGKSPGVYNSWAECQAQTDGYASARFKSFKSRHEAEYAFAHGPEVTKSKSATAGIPSQQKPRMAGHTPIAESICVDAAWNTKTKVMEYRCVETSTGKELFREGPFEDGTNNVGEFLAIVHALSWCKKAGRTCAIYSDSYNAIKWVTQKKLNTHLVPTQKNAKLFAMMDRAIQLLTEQEFTNPILKWETNIWGENPADFGRK